MKLFEKKDAMRGHALVGDQLIFNDYGSLKFRFIKLDIKMLATESKVKGISMLSYTVLDIGCLDYYEMPAIHIEELPRSSHLYQINRIQSEEGKKYTSYHKNLVQLTIGNDAFVVGVSKSGKPYQVANVEAMDQFLDKSGCPPDTGLIHYHSQEFKVRNKTSLTINL